MRRAPSRRRGSDGFLLVEALATMAIGATILVGLSTLVGLMLRTADRAAAAAHGLEQTDRTVAALTREIGSLTRARWYGSEPRAFIFVGEPDRIMFARTTSKVGAPATTAVVTVQSAGARLLYAEAPLAPGAASLADLRFALVRDMHEGAIAVRFAYFGRAGESGGERLVDAWPAGPALPSAVRISILDSGTGRLLRSLRVPVLIEAEPGCAAPEEAFCSRADPRKRAQAEAPAQPARSGQR